MGWCRDDAGFYKEQGVLFLTRAAAGALTPTALPGPQRLQRPQSSQQGGLERPGSWGHEEVGLLFIKARGAASPPHRAGLLCAIAARSQQQGT